jgi:5-methylcytosine-specific restriction endonuclease McrA
MQCKKYHELNKADRLNYQKEYYIKNRERRLAQNSKWAKDNRDKKNEHWMRRRTKKLQQTPEHSSLEKSMIQALYFISKVLSNSCEEKFHVDHIKPINKGGLHTFDNLQILAATENIIKSDSWHEGGCY